MNNNEAAMLGHIFMHMTFDEYTEFYSSTTTKNEHQPSRSPSPSTIANPILFSPPPSPPPVATQCCPSTIPKIRLEFETTGNELFPTDTWDSPIITKSQSSIVLRLCDCVLNAIVFISATVMIHYFVWLIIYCW